MENHRKRILIVGGGVAALEACLALHWDASIEAHVTLVTASDEFVYRPLAVLEPFGHVLAPRFRIEEVIEGCVDEIIHDQIDRFDLARNIALTAGGRTLEFDAAIIATGAKSKHSVPNAIVVGAPGAMERLAIAIARMDAGLVRRIVFSVPQGASWSLPAYELAMLTAARARHAMRDVTVEILTPDAKPLIEFGEAASKNLARLLKDASVDVKKGYEVLAYDGEVLTTNHGWESAPGMLLVVVPELCGVPLAGLPHDKDGFLPVDEFCLVRGTKNVYAAGDITDFRIKQGGVSAQQADVVVGAITERFGGNAAFHPFEPELRALLLSHRGRTFMQATIGEQDEYFEKLVEESRQPITEKISSKHLTRRLNALMVQHATVT